MQSFCITFALSRAYTHSLLSHVRRKPLSGGLGTKESLFLRVIHHGTQLALHPEARVWGQRAAPSPPVFPEEKLNWVDSAQQRGFFLSTHFSNTTQRTGLFFCRLLVPLLLGFHSFGQSCWPDCLSSIVTLSWDLISPLSWPENSTHLADWCAEPLSLFPAKSPICLSSTRTSQMMTVQTVSASLTLSPSL